MAVDVKAKGDYELYETDNDNRILALNNERYAWVKGDKGELLVHTDTDHHRKKTLRSGRFYRVDFRDDPKFNDQPHLFLERDEKFEEWIIPEGLPTENDHQKKLVTSDETIGVKELEGYLAHPATAES